MYRTDLDHDTFASYAGAFSHTRTAAMASASNDAVTARLVAELAEPATSAEPADAADAMGGEGVTVSVTTVANPMAAIDPRDLAFQILRASAEDDAGRAFVDGVKRLSDARTPVPWSVRGPGLQSVMRFIGVEAANDEEEARFASLLNRATHLLTPAEGAGSTRRKRRGAAETYIGRIRIKLDDLPLGTPIPRWLKSERASWPGLSVMLNEPLSKLQRRIEARREVKSRLEDGRLVLGQPYMEGKAWRDAVRPARERLMAVIASHANGPERRPIDVEPLGVPKVLIEPMLDKADVTEPRIREALMCDLKVRRELARVTAIVGTRRAGEAAPVQKPLLVFEDLVPAGMKEAEEAFRVRRPDADDAAVVKAGVDERSFINRAMRVNGWTGQSDVFRTLLADDAEAAIKKGCTQVPRSDANYLGSMERWSKIAVAMIASRKLGMTFGERVTIGIRRMLMSAKAFADRYELPYDTLLKWQRGLGMPTSHQIHLVHRIEKAFGEPKGELVEMLGVVRGGRNNTQRKTIRLDDGRTVQLKRYLCFLPADAIDWSENRLREAVAEADRRHYGAMTVNTIRQKAVSAISRARSPIDPSCPMLAEWKDLVTFKTSLNDPTRYLCPKWEWNSSRTVEKNENHMKDFARWCAMPREQGGLGLPWHQISFILVLNHQVVSKYVFHRVLRFSRLTLEGKELGPMLGGTEFGFMGFIKSLLDLEYGWLTQSPHVVQKPQVVDVQFELERMSALDNVFTVQMPERPDVCTVMDADLVARITTDWMGAVRHARHMISSLTGKVERHYKMIRDPHKLVWPIINHTHPVAVVIRQVKEALSRCRPIEVCPMQHAKDYRNAVAMLMLITVVFRSDTLRNMEYRSDGTGHLIRTAAGYDVIVGADRFKNGMCEWLFGPSYRRRDYERALGDWQSLTAILDYYLKICRPILLKGRESDLLFPTGQSAEKWSSKTFNTMITNWTRTWSVRNERHGTGMTGVLPWGPHCIRDIVATHIILHFPGEERWELAAAILCTGVELVKTRYAFVNSKRELGKADGVYNRAFALGFGDDDLSNLPLAA